MAIDRVLEHVFYKIEGRDLSFVIELECVHIYVHSFHKASCFVFERSKTAAVSR